MHGESMEAHCPKIKQFTKFIKTTPINAFRRIKGILEANPVGTRLSIGGICMLTAGLSFWNGSCKQPEYDAYRELNRIKHPAFVLLTDLSEQMIALKKARVEIATGENVNIQQVALDLNEIRISTLGASPRVTDMEATIEETMGIYYKTNEYGPALDDILKVNKAFRIYLGTDQQITKAISELTLRPANAINSLDHAISELERVEETANEISKSEQKRMTSSPP